MNWKIPTIEEIYNEYHRVTFFESNGVYPKSIKNFEKLHADNYKMQHLLKFQDMIKRNRESIDWKLYITALAKVFKNRFDVKYLGSFGGNKIYRDYVKSLYLAADEDISKYNHIINSIKFLSMYLKENEISFKEYFELNRETVPIALKHIYAGTINLYFYACFSQDVLLKLFNYPDDIFLEYFNLTKFEFLQTYILNKRTEILTNNKIQPLIKSLESFKF